MLALKRRRSSFLGEERFRVYRDATVLERASDAVGLAVRGRGRAREVQQFLGLELGAGGIADDHEPGLQPLGEVLRDDDADLAAIELDHAAKGEDADAADE